MKRFYVLIVFLLLFIFKPTTSLAQSDTGWQIDSFNSDIFINEDTSVEIKETIFVDFFDLKKHGIYRDIPINYKTANGNNLNIKFDNLHVTNANGESINTSVNKVGKNITIKIGDPDITVTGKQSYIINYRLRRVITKPNNKAEFYWNVTGNNWPVLISNATATIHSSNKSLLKAVCFTGIYSSSASDCKVNYFNDLTVVESKHLTPGENFTVAISLANEKLTFPGKVQEIRWFIEDNLIFISPLIVFLVMLYIYMKKGRDKKYKNIFYEQAGVDFVSPFEKVKGTFTFEPPDDLSPGEVGLLVDEKVHNRDITAIAIDLARRGYFKIKETKTGKIFSKIDFELVSSGKDESTLREFEIAVLNMLFGKNRVKDTTIKLSKLPKNAYKYQKEVQDKLYEDMTKNNYFSSNPAKVRNKYIIWGIVVFVLFVFGISLEGIFPALSAGGFIFSGFLSFIIIVVFGLFMPARTAKGRKALADVVGLREYIRVGVGRQQKYESWNYFEEILPFTIAFGLTHKFINAFKSANIKEPDWYQANGSFNPAAFVGTIGSFDSTFTSGINSTRPKSASSGGSGFSGGSSGGGFGGGGGGSW